MEGQPRLESWKEISAYLKRSLSTCHRWEEELGLPIHRLDGTPKARVFAFPEELDRWMGEKLHLAEALAKEDGLTRRRTNKRILVAGGIIALAGGLAMAAWLILAPPPPVPFNNPWLAALPFENAMDDESLEPWATAFPDLLTTDLRQSRFINVLGLSEVDSALHNLGLSERQEFALGDLRKIAAELDVDYLTTGTLARAGEDIIVKVLVYDARGRQGLSTMKSGVGETAFMSMADMLSREIKAAAKPARQAVSHDIDRPVARISTASPEAFKLYSRGYRLIGRGKLEESLNCLQKAVGIDPEFGLAYKALYGAARNSGREEDQPAYAEAAIRNSRRLSERELLLLEVEYYDVLRKNKAKAREVYEKLWALFPDYPEAPGGRLFLRDLYWEMEEYDKLIAALDRLGTRRRRQLGDSSLLFECYLAKGMFDMAEKYIGDYSALNPGRQDIITGMRISLLTRRREFSGALALAGAKPGQDAHFSNALKAGRLGYVFWASDDFAGAEKVYGTVIKAGDLWEEEERSWNLAVVALSEGKLGRLADIARRRIEIAGTNKNAEDETRWRSILALALRLSGHWPEALAESEEAIRGYEKQGLSSLWARQLRALITLDLDRTAEFDAQVEEIRKVVEREPNKKLLRVYYHLLGQRELRKGEADRARGFFWKALDLLLGVRQGLADGDPARHFYALAEAFFLGGSVTDAISYYEKVVSTTHGRSWSGDIYAKSFYRMAKAYGRLLERQAPSARSGDVKAKAIENYRKFLELWKDADPIFPEMEDAKRSLAALEAGRPDRP